MPLLQNKDASYSENAVVGTNRIVADNFAKNKSIVSKQGVNTSQRQEVIVARLDLLQSKESGNVRMVSQSESQVK
jgi:hypothetical protein